MVSSRCNKSVWIINHRIISAGLRRQLSCYWRHFIVSVCRCKKTTIDGCLRREEQTRRKVSGRNQQISSWKNNKSKRGQKKANLCRDARIRLLFPLEPFVPSGFVLRSQAGALTHSCRLTSMFDETILFGGLWFGSGSGLYFCLTEIN